MSYPRDRKVILPTKDFGKHFYLALGTGVTGVLIWRFVLPHPEIQQTEIHSRLYTERRTELTNLRVLQHSVERFAEENGGRIPEGRDWTVKDEYSSHESLLNSTNPKGGVVELNPMLRGTKLAGWPPQTPLFADLTDWECGCVFYITIRGTAHEISRAEWRDGLAKSWGHSKK